MGEYECYTPMYRKGSNVLLPPPLLFRPATKSFQNFKSKVLDNVKSEINRSYHVYDEMLLHKKTGRLSG